MSYGDDQCVLCGELRVTGSILCPACLVVYYNNDRIKLKKRDEEIIRLEGQVEKLKGLCERLLDHITQDMIAASDLDEQIREYWNRV